VAYALVINKVFIYTEVYDTCIFVISVITLIIERLGGTCSAIY